MLKLIAGGDRESIRFYLRCFGKQRGWVETTRVEGSVTGAIAVFQTPNGMTQEIFSEVAKQLALEI